jgi:hypothetical protein
MARTLCTLLACVALLGLPGCGSGQARTGLRNAVVAAQYLQRNPDPAVQATGKAIEEQVSASADQFDEVLWGLWTDRSKHNVSLEDWEDSWHSALRRSLLQAEATRQETLDNSKAMEGATGLLGALGLPLGAAGGSGILAIGAWLMKNRQDLKKALTTAVGYGKEVEVAVTPEQVEKVKNKYRPLANSQLKAAIAKTKPYARVP